jgi:hypothetical protein
MIRRVVVGEFTAAWKSAGETRILGKGPVMMLLMLFGISLMF